VQELFYPVLLGVRHSIAPCESLPVFATFVLLKIVILRKIVVWNIGGTILAGEKTEVRSRGGILALPLCPP